MQVIKNFKLVFFVALLIFPSTVKLTHVLAGHQHIYCDNYTDSHFHEKTLNCELFQFHQVPLISIIPPHFKPFEAEIGLGTPVSPYHFLSDDQIVCFELRGPPAGLMF